MRRISETPKVMIIIFKISAGEENTNFMRTEKIKDNITVDPITINILRIFTSFFILSPLIYYRMIIEV